MMHVHDRPRIVLEVLLTYLGSAYLPAQPVPPDHAEQLICFVTSWQNSGNVFLACKWENQMLTAVDRTLGQSQKRNRVQLSTSDMGHYSLGNL
ncbi:uncharacterized protein HD556DRAFT_1342081 [Suillus plorans]|uniref:Uncharacterized protein n=1 Tax=Suillus plorans TaxID=116603 RepID=A0A9P7DQ92_9AGAM|nr:uncharacterized protein HD556DRAFT_1342081 [Suillus plorans]KAG1800277.1 hypothetical protein HD556DRAFT_1342081 [Suillus plorans]